MLVCRRLKGTEVEVSLSHEDIMSLLRQKMELPDNARIYVPIPGGGDWSNRNLDIGSGSFKDNTKLKVTWFDDSDTYQHCELL